MKKLARAILISVLALFLLWIVVELKTEIDSETAKRKLRTSLSKCEVVKLQVHFPGSLNADSYSPNSVEWLDVTDRISKNDLDNCLVSMKSHLYSKWFVVEASTSGVPQNVALQTANGKVSFLVTPGGQLLFEDVEYQLSSSRAYNLFRDIEKEMVTLRKSQPELPQNVF